MMPMQMQQLQHMQAVTQQQVPNQSQAQQQPPSQTQQTSQTPHLQNQQFLSAHTQHDQNQRNVIKQRESSLFNSYVYDFLKRSGAHETARTYLREGENLKIKNDGANSINGSGNSSSDNDVGGPLPDADVPVQAPEGFLYEWWTVFWDIYSVKLNRQGTMEAQRYVAERRGNRGVMGQIPTMNAYQNPQVVTAQAAQVAAVQQQQMRMMQQQIPQHPPQAQQTSQQTVQQQPQQAPSQPSQPPQQPQQTPQQPQPQPSPANHQPQQFNNRQQIPNGVIDNNTNGDMLATSPQRANTLKLSGPQRARMMQIPQQVSRNAMMQLQQQQQQHAHQALQNNSQTQAVQSQAQNSQPIQSQGQQNSGVNPGQVQQQNASQVHMTPNQAKAQLNPGTKRGIEAQAINQSLNMSTSPNKRPKMEYSSAITGQRQQQPPNQQPGQIPMSSNMILTTPVSNEIAASPDRQAHLSNVKKNNPQQLQQIPRGPQQMTPMNKPHQQIPIVQNAVVHDNSAEYMNQMNQIQNHLSKQITVSNQMLQNISSVMPQGVRIQQNYMNNMMIPQQQKRLNQMNPNAAMLQLSKEQRNLHELGQMSGRPIPQLYAMLPHQMPTVADVGPNNNSAQQLRKNEVKGVKNGKTTPTQSQPQVPNGNVSNVATPQQQTVIGANEVPNQLSQLTQNINQIPAQTSSTEMPDGSSLEMNINEVNNYPFPIEGDPFEFTDYLNFDLNEDQLGSGNNAGPSNGN